MSRVRKVIVRDPINYHAYFSGAVLTTYGNNHTADSPDQRLTAHRAPPRTQLVPLSIVHLGRYAARTGYRRPAR